MEQQSPFLFLLMFSPILVIAIVGLIIVEFERKRSSKLSRQWDFLAEGKYDHAEYGMEYYTRKSGAMVHTTRTHSAKMTVVFLEDGRCFTTKGFYDMEYPKGTIVRVSRNGLNHLKIEKT